MRSNHVVCFTETLVVNCSQVFSRLTMSLKRLKSADFRTKCIIFGYSRENMQEFSINLPTMIQYLFLMYYWIQEKFTEHGDNMELDINHQKLIRFAESLGIYCNNTSYGNNNTIDINDTSIARYIWSFRYASSTRLGMQFCIKCSGLRCKNIALNRYKQAKYYRYCANGWGFANNGYRRVSDCDDHRGVLHLILDVLEDKLLISKHDEKKEYVVADNIDLKNNKYNMTASGALIDGDEIELISFKIVQR